MCTDQDGTRFKKISNIPEEGDQVGKIDAGLAFGTDQRMYKQNDYRCLKPKSTVKPGKWPYYEMEGFRTAKSKEELEKVKEYQYDNYFFNFEDPKVFKKKMKGKKGPKLWRKTYGFDFVSISKYRTHPVRAYQCIKNCYRAEYGKFANGCRKSKGFFKCCLTSSNF